MREAIMKFLKLLLAVLLIFTFVAEESDAARKRRRGGRRARSKIYSPPSKFELEKRKASFEIKKDKLILSHEKGRTEEPIPFQTKQDKVAGMAYIPMGGRDFIQMIVWVVDVKGNLSPAITKADVNTEEVGQLLYWDLYEIVEDKIIWRQHQLLDQFVGQMNQEIPSHIENAIQLSLDESGKVFYRRGAIEEAIATN